MDFKLELSKIEEKVNNAKLEKARKEEHKKHLNEERAKILDELKKKEIAEDKLSDKIIDLELELQEGIDKIKEILK